MPIIRRAFLVIMVTFGVGAAVAATRETDFMEQNATVMDRMMKSMSVKPSGDVDTDFVNLMEPHHQSAIDMAVLELQYGRNEQLRRIAQEIVAQQQQEIDGMRGALGRPLARSAPPPERAAPAQ